MPDFSLRGHTGREEEAGADATDSGAAAITGGANGGNIKGSYVQLIASTAFVSSYITINIKSAASASFLFDFAVGADESEQDVISSLLVCIKSSDVTTVTLPLAIAAGSRISARCQTTGQNEVSDVQIRLHGGGFSNAAPLGRCTTYGAATGDTGGVQVDPGGTADTKGGYSQITAATTNPIRMLLISLGNQDNFTSSGQQGLLDIAVGAGTSEEIIISDILYGETTQKDSFAPQFIGPTPANIPNGSRIAAQAQSSINDATDRLFDVVVYGFD